MLTLAYGYSTDDEDDRMVNLVNEAMDQFSETTASNAFLVDVFPFREPVRVLISISPSCLDAFSSVCARLAARRSLEKESRQVPRDGTGHAELAVRLG